MSLHSFVAALLSTGVLLSSALLAAEHQAPPGSKNLPEAAADALAALPQLPLPTTVAASDLPQLQQLAPGVQYAPGSAHPMVVLDGTMLLDQGPTDGMEVLICLREGKTHEALMRLAVSQGHLVKAACIAAFGVADGVPSGIEYSGQPARGTPMSLMVRWTANGSTVQIPASSLVRDRVVDRPYPELPFLYTGSRFETIAQRTVEGKIIERQVFMLDSTRSLVVNFDEPDALLASPFPGADTDLRFEANSRLCPPAGTPVQVVIAPITLPMQVVMGDDGSLRDTTDQVLDDTALTAQLSAAFPATFAGPRAIAVRVAASVPRAHDLTARSRLLRVAAAAKIWAVPVFVAK